MFPNLRSSRRLLSFGLDADRFDKMEEDAISNLAIYHKRLRTEEGRLDMKSEEGHVAISNFLGSLEAVATTLKLEPAPRDYRSEFTVNYRALFPDHTRNYRVDVLEASSEQFAVIWVNGEKFEFSADAMGRAEELQCAWADVMDMVERWGQTKPKPTRSQVLKALTNVDEAWATFERIYITELMNIEGHSRQLLVTAIQHEQNLTRLEAYYGKGEDAQRAPNYKEEQRALVRCILKLNSVANVRRKGRDDLSADILFDATEALRRCDKIDGSILKGSDRYAAARVLATDVVESFDAMRTYFREVSQCLERVDPHLCNNAGLVARLVDWEESWEVGARYVQNEHLLDALCDVVSEVRAAEQLVPAIAAMCEDCDVELFLVLPRIIWLRFLTEPAQQLALIKSLLPHRFVGHNEAQPWDKKIVDFLNKFGCVLSLMGQDRATSLAVLMKRVILGSGPQDIEEVYRAISPQRRQSVESAVEDLMRELEAHSMEIQRHCAEDWNQCSAILVQCLSNDGEKEKENNKAFGV